MLRNSQEQRSVQLEKDSLYLTEREFNPLQTRDERTMEETNDVSHDVHKTSAITQDPYVNQNTCKSEMSAIVPPEEMRTTSNMHI